MPDNFYLLSLVILIAAGTMTVTVCLLDRWLAKMDKPQLCRPLRVRKIKKKYEPSAPARRTVYPDDGKRQVNR